MKEQDFPSAPDEARTVRDAICQIEAVNLGTGRAAVVAVEGRRVEGGPKGQNEKS